MPTDNICAAEVASVIMAAGRGSRMIGYTGNKTLLPLDPGPTAFEGEQSLLLHLLEHLPAGPKAVIVHHCKEDVYNATGDLDLTYCEQPKLNGTGGAILAAREYIQRQTCERFLITMGDVPFVRKQTYAQLVNALDLNDMVILGFTPADKKQYGVLEIKADKVEKITEWKYWKDYEPTLQSSLTVCNSGIYAAKRSALLEYLPVLESRPQIVRKEINGQMTDIEEYFITDLIEYMVEDAKPVGFHVVADEIETMGIDDGDALQKAQALFQAHKGAGPDKK